MTSRHGTAEQGVTSDLDEVVTRRAGYRRPSAPPLALGAAHAALAAVAPDEGSAGAPDEPTSTTLISRRGEMADLARPLSSRCDGLPVRVEEAADEEPAPDSGLDGDFFRDGLDSYPPVVSVPELDDRPPLLRPSPAQLRRRSVLRRSVGIMVAAVAMVAVGLGVKAAAGGSVSQAERHQAAAAAVLSREAPRAAAQLRQLEAARDARIAAKEKAEPAAPSDVAPASYHELADATVELLEDRDLDAAAEHARQLIGLQPDLAFGYRCLGAALQDQGRLAEARAAYNDCVHHATHGEVQECAALGGH